jgi:hypothetical protein
MLDASRVEEGTVMPPIGYFLPGETNGGFRPQSVEGVYPKPDPYCSFRHDSVPNVYDLEVRDGIVYVVDYHTGLYVVTRDDSVV